MLTKLLLILVFVTSTVLTAVVLKNERSCSAHDLTCDDGECVRGGSKCDGKPDCPDGSDEKTCYDPLKMYISRLKRQTMKTCRDNEWQCTDGSCIKLKEKCDGQADCPDRSDEADAQCRSINTSTLCTLPQYPEHGRYTARGISNALPGDSFKAVFLNVSCDPRYGIEGARMVYCYEGIWSERMPQCVRYCKLDPHPSVVYNCLVIGANDGRATRRCQTSEPPGTTVIPECRTPNYYHTGILPYMHCIDGSWDYVAACSPECGTVTPEGEILIIGGHNAKRGELPWQVGIYTKTVTPYMQICSGSLISTTAVISAAHCFWSNTDKRIKLSNYAVAVGKLFRKWDAPDDDDAQKSDVSSVEIPLRFRGSSTNFQDDIALVIVVTAFEFKPHVRPVCLDFDISFNQKHLQNGMMGKIGGWGLTSENGEPSPILKVVEMPYVNIEICISELPWSFREYVTSDKICAGFKNGTALCRGDGGGGLTFPETNLGIQRYYLRGVLSTTPVNENLCNANTISAFTEVVKHQNFIKENLENNKWQCGDKSWISINKKCDGAPDCPDGSDEDNSLCKQSSNEASDKITCILPEYPSHGEYAVLGYPNAFPGQKFQSVFLNVTCEPGYGVKGTNTLFCLEGSWSQQMPQCVRYCRLTPHPSVEYYCILDEITNGAKATRRCNEYELTGTTVRAECRRPNYYNSGILPFMNCVAGAWDYIAVCKPECGTVIPEGVMLVANGQNARRGELPWHAAIYTKTTKPYRQICGGTMISVTAVVSAAHCFWRDGQKLLEANYAVAVGKLYRPWNNPRDNDSQKRDVKRIEISKRFQGQITHFQDDIAVLIVATAFEYRPNVRPVCIDFDYNFNELQLKPGNLGKVGGWGLTSENGSPAGTLQVVELPYVHINSCFRQVPVEFSQYITSDKFCAGYANGTAMCIGDAGGGLAFREFDRGVERYYLRGILSVAPTNDNPCNVNTLSAFTEVIKHALLIKENLVDSKWKCDDNTLIDLDRQCDGVDDCPDGSDENNILCNKTIPNAIGTKNCILPPYPDHGTYTVQGHPNATPGLSLQNVILKVSCSGEYRVKGSDSLLCFEGAWSAEIPQCARFCRLNPDRSVEYQCLVKFSSYSEKFQSCDEYVPTGDVVKATCAPNYYYDGVHPFMHCDDGVWDYVAVCNPECGTVTQSGSEMLGGEELKNLPWQAGIYRKTTSPYKHICRGSLVTTTAVISAAHCFWSDVERLLPAITYAVAVSKRYRPWNDPQDVHSQKKTDVKSIKIPIRFQGLTSNYQDDIALVIVEKAFVFNAYVRPVCIDFDVNLNRRQLRPDNTGKVVRGTKSGTFKIIDLPYVSTERCIEESPIQFREYITSDKICAGFTNGTTLCKGDGGGGLAFSEIARGRERYYLRGVFSTASSDDGLCSSILTFTEIVMHEQFIRENIAKVQFNCKNGETISESKKCDGVPHCKDGSDETAAACTSEVCGGQEFMCAYGACIDIGYKCNNIIDCADGSDETTELCAQLDGDLNPSPIAATALTTTTTTTTTTAKPSETTMTYDASEEVTSSQKCILPPQPENGVYHILGGKVIDGEAKYVHLKYSCYPRFAMIGDPKVFCWEGTWSFEEQPQCLQTCQLERHDSMEYNCVINGTESTRTCNDYEVEGTVIQPSCKEPNYYTPLELPYMICKHGGWNVRPSCVPECGTLTPKGSALGLGGEIAKFGDVPWHAGIYYKNEATGSIDQICGGSLISTSVVLSAAHCFWNERERKIKNSMNYAIAVGKLYRDWDNPDDAQYAQKSDVKKIVVPAVYRGISLNYRDDIAVVIASAPFEYQVYVRPVCIDFRHELNDIQLQTGNLGKASGWGLTTGDKGSESKELKVFDMPFVSYSDCIDQTPSLFAEYITYDKICAGDVEGLLLCRGDSGGGLAFPATILNTQRFFLRGIASTSPPSTDTKLCNTHSLTGFTAISKHRNLIKTYWLV